MDSANRGCFVRTIALVEYLDVCCRRADRLFHLLPFLIVSPANRSVQQMIGYLLRLLYRMISNYSMYTSARPTVRGSIFSLYGNLDVTSPSLYEMCRISEPLR
jgi:hypothetical protein